MRASIHDGVLGGGEPRAGCAARGSVLYEKAFELFERTAMRRRVWPARRLDAIPLRDCDSR